MGGLPGAGGGVSFNIARDRDMERAEAFREQALEWADDEDYDYDDLEELDHAFADYCEMQYEAMQDRKFDELRDRCLS